MEQSHVREHMDRRWASRSIRYELGEGQNGRYRRKEFRSERRHRQDHAEGSLNDQAAISLRFILTS